MDPIRIAPLVEKIKNIAQTKGSIIKNPPNGVEALCIKEQKIGKNYSASIAVGTVKSLNVRFFDIVGKVFDDTFFRFSDSDFRIEPKAISSTKGIEYFCYEFKPGLVRAVDEASWVNKFTTLDDLIAVLEKL